MPATRNSKPSRISKRTRQKGSRGGGYVSAALALILFAVIGVFAAWWVYGQGYTLYYNDGEVHLNIARRIVDGRNPGYDQVGTSWLPLPHALMLPFVTDDWLWRSGLAGVIPSVACFVLAGWFLFLSVRRTFSSTAAGFTAALVFALNPNLLYLQATPMTETVFFGCQLGLLYLTVLFHQTQAGFIPAAAGIVAALGCVARYDGWWLLPFTAIFFLIGSREHRWRNALVFSFLAAAGPLYWLGHNWWYYGDALEFYRGKWSARAIYQRAIDAGMARAPGDHDWTTALRYFAEAARMAVGLPGVVLGGMGIVAAVWRRAWWPLLFTVLTPVFYIISIYSATVPIFLPHLWPHNYYNTRYALSVLPLLAIGCGALIAILPTRRALAAAGIAGLVSLPWLLDPKPDAWICWSEGKRNYDWRSGWTKEAADFLRANYRPGTGIIVPFGNLTGILRIAGLDLRESMHEGDNPHWDGMLARPDLFLWDEWAIAISADPVSTMLQRAQMKGPKYRCVKIVAYKGAPVIEIYRREPRSPVLNDNSVYEGARRQE